MPKRTFKQALLPVVVCLLCSPALAVVAWFGAIIVLTIVCFDLYGDELVVTFGDSRAGLFATYVPWMPPAAAAVALSAPWLWLIRPRRWGQRKGNDQTLPGASN